ncbi:uncharacterized protein TM35_000113230 [Trypanosoma theileri]|uniref:CCDC22 N-terminal domain-containing protein n=1 Tax=Trypanosoma theileri TaxID=67003 RepID=A0A1X0NZY9_9TRYP|nr:uncharacterized protein TM35_000113230 [Trypanosoma theileri]ORC89789.1 hypothetical protein TM35_000113230 [Trypanosoma theileri]
METEITIAQLRHCGVQVPIQTSLRELTAVSLYELLITALKRLHFIHEENTNEKFPISLMESDTATRLHYLSILTTKLQEVGCDFIQDEHLMYPAETTTRRLLLWLVRKFHTLAATQNNNNDKKYKNSPMGEALLSFQSLVQNYNLNGEKRNREEAYIHPNRMVSTVWKPFSTVSVCRPEEIDSNISRWKQIEKEYESMCTFTSPKEQKEIKNSFWKLQFSEVFLHSFQESCAADRTYDDNFIHHNLKNSLITKNKKINNDKSLLNIPLNSKSPKESILPINLNDLQSFTFTNDVFFYNPSEDGVRVEGVSVSDISSIYDHKDQTVNALQTILIGDAEKHKNDVDDVNDYDKTSLTENEKSILSNYNKAKKELWILRNTFSELKAKKIRLDDDLQNLSHNLEEQENVWNQSKKEAQRLEEILTLMGDEKESENQIRKEIDELIELAESFRSEVMVKLQKVTNKRSELLEELHAVSNYKEEELASMRHAVKEVKKRIRAKRQDIQKWKEDISPHVDGIDRLQFLRYIGEMTSSACGLQTQLTTVVRDTLACVREMEALERHLRLDFARREAAVYTLALQSESGGVWRELHRSMVGVREGYRALMNAIVHRGELLVELHRMEDRVENLKAEVNACNSVKVEDDVKELRERNNAIHEYLQQNKRKKRVSTQVMM